jgi:hypothetical protein
MVEVKTLTLLGIVCLLPVVLMAGAKRGAQPQWLLLYRILWPFLILRLAESAMFAPSRSTVLGRRRFTSRVSMCRRISRCSEHLRYIRFRWRELHDFSRVPVLRNRQLR